MCRNEDLSASSNENGNPEHTGIGFKKNVGRVIGGQLGSV